MNKRDEVLQILASVGRLVGKVDPASMTKLLLEAQRLSIRLDGMSRPLTSAMNTLVARARKTDKQNAERSCLVEGSNRKRCYRQAAGVPGVVHDV